MEFWGVEVKPGQALKVEPEFATLVHISQASLGEAKKGSESVVLYVKVGDEKFVIGNLSHDKFPQLSFDLVFEKEFELSHNWRNGSIYIIGYKSSNDEEFSDEMDSDEEEPSLVPVGLENGKTEKKGDQAVAKGKAVKSGSSTKPTVSKDDEDDDSDEDDNSEDSEDESGSDEEIGDGESDDESDEDEEDEKTPTPKKVESAKKRPLESATKTPTSKKAKANTPQKTDGKKSVHVDTPHPSKNAAKTPGNKPQTPGNKPQTPKSGSQFSCNSCKKSFSSDMGLQSHNKAKHSAK